MPPLPVIEEYATDFPSLPGPDQIHVWHLPLAAGDPDPSPLSADERLRLERITSPQRRRMWLNSRLCLRRILGRYLQRQPRELQFRTTRKGKPFLPGQPLTFNLSHAGNLGLLAVANQLPVGIDLEQVRTVGHMASIGRRMFQPDETQLLMETHDTERQQHFFELWTRLEARQKLSGEGVFGARNGECSLHSFVPETGYLATLAWPIDSQAGIRFFKFLP